VIVKERMGVKRSKRMVTMKKILCKECKKLFKREFPPLAPRRVKCEKW